MRHVQLEHVEARLHPEAGCAHKGVPHLIHVRSGHFDRDLADALVIRQRRGSHDRPIALGQRVIHLLPTDLSRAFAPGVSELEADFGGRVGVNEFNDPLPGVPLLRIPQPRAAGCDPALWGDARHFRVNESSATQRAMPVMYEVPIGRHTVFRAILRHRRDHHPIHQFQTAKLERQKHRWTCPNSAVLASQPFLIARDKLRVTHLEILVSDALTARQQAVRKLLRRQMHVPGDVLKPFHAVAGSALELEDLHIALLVIRAERGVEIIRRGHVFDE